MPPSDTDVRFDLDLRPGVRPQVHALTKKLRLPTHGETIRRGLVLLDTAAIALGSDATRPPPEGMDRAALVRKLWSTALDATAPGETSAPPDVPARLPIQMMTSASNALDHLVEILPHIRNRGEALRAGLALLDRAAGLRARPEGDLEPARLFWQETEAFLRHGEGPGPTTFLDGIRAAWSRLLDR